MNNNYFEFKVLSKSIQLHFSLPIFFTIIIAILLAQFTISLQPNSPVTFFDSEDEFFIMINIFFIIIISILSLFIFFRFFKKRQELAVRILVAIFIISGVLAALLFVKLIFTALKLEFPLVLIVTAVVTYIGSYFGYLVIVDTISNRMRNALFVICSGILGSFFGVLVPSFPIIICLLLLSIVDMYLIQRNTVEKVVGKLAYEKMITEITFSNKNWGIGIGDLTCYSIVVSNTAINFGFLFGAFSLLLILIGSFVSLRITFRNGRFPGLPISIILGLLPAIIHLFLM